MWTSDKKIHNEKFFSSQNLLEARREAFAYADNLVEIMEEARLGRCHSLQRTGRNIESCCNN